METKDALTVAQAAAALGLDAATVRRRLASGVMQGERVGERLWLIPRAEVARWLGKGKLKPGPKGPRRRRRKKGSAT